MKINKPPHDKLYYDKEIVVTHPDINNNQEIELNIETMTLWHKEPDCKIGHFGYNFFVRTPYGVKGKEYANTKTMEKAIEKTLTNNGFKIIKWIPKT